MVLFHLAIIAQNCTDESVKKLPGKWKAGMKGDSDHSAADMVKEKALMDDIIQSIRSSFTWSPVGGEITYGNTYSIRGLDYRPLPVIKICHQYHPYIFYQHYFCGYGKPMLEDFIVEVTVNINDIPFEFPSSFFRSKKDKLGYDLEKDPETDVYGRIENVPEEKNGTMGFEKISGGATGGDVTTKYRILTKPGQLPYSILSKKDFYEKCKIQHNRDIEECENAKIKMASGGTVDKGYMARQDENIVMLRNYLNKIDQVLISKTVAELAAPALDSEGNGDYYDSGTKEFNMYYIIRPNIDYYNSQLPKSSPQVITIKYTYKSFTDKYGDKTFADEAFYNELERIKIVDLLTAKLQPLLAR
jgi:hypothetical protein